ncbi:unnamed protein product [Brassica oleracea]
MMNYLVFFCYHLSILGGTASSQPRISREHTFTFLIEMQLSIPYSNRESGLST